MSDKEQNTRLEVIEFKNYTQANYSWSRGQKWVNWGECNAYPDYLIGLYNKSAIHGSIVKGKGQYLFGKGLTYNGDGSILNQAKVLNYLDHANRWETWDEVYAKTCRTFELFNGFAWQIIWNKGKTAFEVFHMDIAKLRRSKCGKKVYFCEAWLIDNNGVIEENAQPEKHPSFKEFPIFNPKVKTESVFYYRLEVPSSMQYSNLYPIPDYSGAIMPIETLIEIDVFRFNHLKHGMFASSLVSLFNGEPTPEEKKKIKKMFDYTHTGSSNAGKVILNFVNEGGTPADIKNLSQSDLDKLFEGYEKSCTQQTFTAHKVHPLLFGVMTEGSLSDTSGEAIIKKWDQFLRAYVEGRQEVILNPIIYLASIMGIDLEGLEVKQMTPVGLTLPNDANIHQLFSPETLKKYYAKLYNIDIVDEVTPNVSNPQMNAVNEHLKKLSGRDWQHIKRMVREVQNGKATRETGAMMLKNGYGLSDEDINTLFATPQAQFKKFEIETRDRTDELVALFEKFAIDDNADDVIKEEFIHGELDAFKFEAKAHKFISDLEGSVLDMLTGNPQITPEEIARQLQITPEEVLAVIATLITVGLVVAQSGVLSVTEKGIKKDVEPVETEVYTVYKYVKRDDVPDLKGGRSRAFCQKMVALSSAGKRWTREAIENITNQFGEDAWTYRGGFYTNPNNKETTPYCRHIWRGVVKTRKRGKNA